MGKKTAGPFVLRYSNNVVEHLGVKLYQNKPTNALAELVSNAWDADAEHVWVDLSLTGPEEARWITVGDSGSGMSSHQLQNNYLIIARKRRKNEGGLSPIKRRPVMGRKGIGKLAPFGIARVIDLFTLKESQVSWITFELAQMLLETDDPTESVEYRPVVRYQGDINALSSNLTSKQVTQFLKRLETVGASSGTLIVLQSLTFANFQWTQSFQRRLADRMIPALSESDFAIHINSEPLDLTKALPSQALRLPETGWTVETLPSGRTIRWWALVVDLTRYQETFKEDWTQEHAGVAIYAHRKIAQDRPFFFGLTGKEIYTRYLYAVVDADWIDDLDEDLISTDRTSLDWDHPKLSEFRSRGQDLVSQWLKAAAQHLSERNRNRVSKVIQDKVSKLPPRTRDKFSEREVQSMAEIILTLAPDTPVAKVVDITISAVSHLPSWDALKTLVEKAQQGDLSEQVFSQMVFDLRFFENVNLAQVIARRLQAMLALSDLIRKGAREVVPSNNDETASVRSMHDLLRNNPWMLELRWAAIADELPPQLTRQALEEARKRMEQTYNEGIYEFESWRRVGSKSMDFVLLHVREFERALIVVEIKRANKVLTIQEHRQLQDYSDAVRSILRRGSGEAFEVKGILIGGAIHEDLVQHLVSNPYPTLSVKTWGDVTADARDSHQAFLTALAVGLQDDPRLRNYLEDLGYPVPGETASESGESA